MPQLIGAMIAMLLAQDAPPEKPIFIGPGVTTPQVVYKQDPTYTEEARLTGLQGTVSIRMVVSTDGSTRDFKVTKGLGLGLDERAIAAVKTWRFYPGMKDHNAVAVYADVKVNFALKNTPAWGIARVLFDSPSGSERPHVLSSFVPNMKPKDLQPVTVTFLIDEQGLPSDSHVATSDTAVEAALTGALTRWRFKPATKDGIPVAVGATVDFVGLRVE
jgi:TonB family protein